MITSVRLIDTSITSHHYFFLFFSVVKTFKIFFSKLQVYDKVLITTYGPRAAQESALVASTPDGSALTGDGALRNTALAGEDVLTKLPEMPHVESMLKLPPRVQGQEEVCISYKMSRLIAYVSC